jgi:hypothetical protein
MSRFSTGLIEGLAGGVSEQWNKQAQAANAQKKQQLDDYLRVAENPNMPDDQRQRAWDDAQKLLGPGGKGKGKGQAGGAGNPILDKLKGLLLGKHPGGQGQDQGQQPQQDQQGAPAAAAPPPLPQGANGRPTLAGSGPASQEQPAAAPQPAQGAPQQGQPGNPLDAQIDQAQKLLNAIPPEKSFARQRAQKALDALQAEKTKGDAGDYYDQRKQDRLETGREGLAKLKADAAKDKEELEAKHKKELADAALEGKKALEDTQEKHKKELQELKDKDAADLKKYIQAHAPKKTGAAKADPSQKVFAKIDADHRQQSFKATDEYNKAVQKITANTALSLKQRESQMDAARIALDQKTQRIESDYKARVKAAGGNVDGNVKGSTPSVLPPEIASHLKPGVHTSLSDGSVWTKGANGQPEQVQ